MGIYTKEDLKRAEKNVELHEWAQRRKKQMITNANNAIKDFPLDKAKSFIPRTTPGTTTFCPNCVKTGKNWHANGNWAWSKDNPDKITCNVCKMTFPNAEFPEDRVFQSTWDPEQNFSYVSKSGPQTCMSYSNCYSSPSAVIRGKKLQYVIQTVMYNVALGYLVDHNESYATYVRELLLKLANVMPKYLVYEGYSYNEYADCSPRDAAKNILNLPSGCSKITGAGIVEGRELYSGYWSASRLGTSGMDGSTVQKMALAYDFTASSGVYSEEERLTIERDVIEEAAYLGYCDVDINNKAVGNRAGVAISGLVIESHEMSRFGLDGFMSTVNDWFLEDGATSESAAYALQTVSALVVYGKAYRNYSDPEDIETSPKYRHLNVNTDTVFDQVWQYLVWTLQGNFYYAPLADSYVTSTLSSTLSEYLGIHFPLEDYVRLSVERMGSATPSVDALFHRDPEIELVADEPYTFRDVVLPYLAQGYMRTGVYGRNSTVILDASNYGSHHHRDSLNLVYFKDGRELLHDLGYLWDHVDIGETRKTCVHNTVLIDGSEQLTTGRNGSFHTFVSGDGVKIMQASSNAYKQASVYHRTVVQIEHGQESYLVDIFRVKGGDKHEYVFHFPNMNYSLNPESDLKFYKPEGQEEVKFIFQINIQSKDASNPVWIEVSDVIIQEEYLNGSLGDNFVHDAFPSDITGPSTCREGTSWCHLGNTGYTWKSIDGKETGGVHFETTATSKVGLIVGFSDGYTGPNAFSGYLGSRYRVSFFMKASNVPVEVQFTYWPSGSETDKNSRKYPKMAFTEPAETEPGVFPGNISETEWIHYVGYIDIGTRITEFAKMGGQTSKAWEARAAIDDEYTLSAFAPAKPNQWVYLEKGWGQRNYDNSDKGARLPYFYIERTSQEFSTFVCVYEGHRNGEGLVEAVDIVETDSGNVGVRVSTKDGDDFVVSSFNGNQIEAFGRVCDSSVGAELSNGTVHLSNGSFYRSKSTKVESSWKCLSGTTESFSNENSDSWFVVEQFPSSYFTGQSLQITYEDGIERSYPIFDVKPVDGKTRIYTRKGGVGFRVHRNGHWRLSSFATNTTPTPSPTPTPTEQSQQQNKGLTSGQITGIIIGVIFAVLVVSIIGFVLYRRHKRYDSRWSDTGTVSSPLF